MSIIGIDLGSSIIKIIETDEKGEILNKLTTPKGKISEIIETFLDRFKIKIENISKIVITGVGASEIDGNILNIPTIKIDEFIAIGEGGAYLSNKTNNLIISIGTGTAFIKYCNGNSKHIGGTGVGGGTLFNLAKKFANIESYEELINSINNGNLDNVDLTIKDVTTEEIKTLPDYITASNFGKLNENAKCEDIVLGILNMVFETIGMMAAFAIRNEPIKEVVIIGTIATIPRAGEIFSKIEKIQDIKFIIPKNAEYATALGAIRKTLK